MRVYLAAGVAEVEALATGEAVTTQVVVPASEDEADEYAAFDEAAAEGPAVIAADVDAADEPVTLGKVASFHVAVDDSGDLAWFATQEIDAVLLTLRTPHREE